MHPLGHKIFIVLKSMQIVTVGCCTDIELGVGSVLEAVSVPTVLLVGLPFRHDDPSLERVVSDTNTKLRNLASRYDNVTYVPLDTLSRHFLQDTAYI